MRGSIAGARRTCGEVPCRPPHRRFAERLAGHDRLARDDPGRDRDRARDQDLGREPVPDPLELDGADAALCAPDLGCEAHFSDRVLACRFCFRFWGPKRGQIIVFHTPPLAKVKCGAGGTFVKRLIGLPGEGYRRGRQGLPLDHPARQQDRARVEGAVRPTPAAGRGHRELQASLGRPRRAVLLHGRQPRESCDSRAWGGVPRKNLIGKVIATYWPPNRISIR